MKTKYSYFELRFPRDLAEFCHGVEEKLGASFFDMPYLLPLDSTRCRYNDTEILFFQGREFSMANEGMDVVFNVPKYQHVRCFGLINIAVEFRREENKRGKQKLEQRYIFWSNFCDDELIEMLESIDGVSKIRIHKDPTRMSATLVSYRQ